MIVESSARPAVAQLLLVTRNERITIQKPYED